MNSQKVIGSLRRKFPKERGFLLIEQVANTTGFASRYADAIIVNYFQSRYEIIGVEIKVSRSDWQSELKNPAKAEKIYQYCHNWYLAATEKVADPSEIPPGWGFLELRGDDLKTVKKPERNAGQRLDDFFVTSVLRRVMEQASPESELLAAEKRGRDSAWGAALEQARAEAATTYREVERLRKAIKDFETASGIELHNGWADCAPIGEAVKLVLHNGHTRILNDLKRVQKTINESVTILSQTSGSNSNPEASA